MPDHFWEELQFLGCAGGFAGVGGGLHYMLSVREGKKFSWWDFILNVLISFFAGLITFELMSSIGIPPAASGAICGISGWMGAGALKLYESAFVTKIGGNKNE